MSQRSQLRSVCHCCCCCSITEKVDDRCAPSAAGLGSTAAYCLPSFLDFALVAFLEHTAPLTPHSGSVTDQLELIGQSQYWWCVVLDRRDSQVSACAKGRDFSTEE